MEKTYENMFFQGRGLFCIKLVTTIYIHMYTFMYLILQVNLGTYWHIGIMLVNILYMFHAVIWDMVQQPLGWVFCEDWSDATVVFAMSLCFPEEMMEA